MLLGIQVEAQWVVTWKCLYLTSDMGMVALNEKYWEDCIFPPMQSSRGHKTAYHNQEDEKLLITRYFLPDTVLKIQLTKACA